MTTSDIFKSTDGIEVTEVPDGFVIYDETGELVHYLNPAAAIAFIASDGTRSVAEVHELIRDLYEVEQDIDLSELFGQLETCGLLCRVD